MKLPDPQCCRYCGQRGRVINTRMAIGYRRRRRKCIQGCVDDDRKPHKWNSYETVINPRRLSVRAKPQSGHKGAGT